MRRHHESDALFPLPHYAYFPAKIGSVATAMSRPPPSRFSRLVIIYAPAPTVTTINFHVILVLEYIRRICRRWSSAWRKPTRRDASAHA